MLLPMVTAALISAARAIVLVAVAKDRCFMEDSPML
jgi:hypothetical protein